MTSFWYIYLLLSYWLIICKQQTAKVGGIFYLRWRNELKPFSHQKPGLQLVDLLGQLIRGLVFGGKWLEIIFQSQIRGDYIFTTKSIITLWWIFMYFSSSLHRPYTSQNEKNDQGQNAFITRTITSPSSPSPITHHSGITSSLTRRSLCQNVHLESLFFTHDV